MPPTSYSKAEALPNKLFDFVGAGLAVVVGPTPAMAEFVRDHGVGLVTRSFEPDEVAADLDSTDLAQLIAWRSSARGISRQFTAATEMAKVVDLYRRLLAA